MSHTWKLYWPGVGSSKQICLNCLIYDTEICVLARVFTMKLLLILLGNTQHCFINIWFLHSMFNCKVIKPSISLNVSTFLCFYSSTKFSECLWSILPVVFHKFISHVKPTDSMFYSIENFMHSPLGKKKRKPKPPSTWRG